MKKRNRVFTIFLAIAMIVCTIPMVSIESSAKNAIKTQNEAVEWLKSQQDATYNFDGAYGTQCTEFVKAYVNFLMKGDPWTNCGYVVDLNGRDVWQSSFWKNNDWIVYENTLDFIPQPGDIFSAGLSEYGHTGVVISSDSASAVIAEANGRDSIVDNGDPVWIRTITWRASTVDSPYGATHFIRPNFNQSHSHSYVDGVCSCGNSVVPSKPALKNMQKEYLSNEPITFEWTATSNTTHYNFYVYNPQTGEHEDYKLSIEGTSTTMSLPEGEYEAIIQSWNSNYWNSSNTSWLYTEGDRISFSVKSQNKVEVSIRPNGGVYNGSTSSTVGEYYPGSTINLETPTREGYDFVCWTLDYSGTGHKLEPWGTPLHDDPSFTHSDSDISIYNLYDTETVSVNRVDRSSDCPTSSQYMLAINNTGNAYPGLGGFYQLTSSKSDGVFYHIIIAKIPKGYTIERNANSVGDGSYATWLTPQKGTGEFETYIYKLTCGSTGSFSTFGHVYIAGEVGTPSNPVTWYVGYSEVFDGTNCDPNGTVYTVGSGSGKLRAIWHKICEHNSKTLIETHDVTCTSDGYSIYNCPDCGETYEDNFIGALGHNYEAVNIDATCTENGYVRYTCTRCGDTYDEVPGEWSEWSTETPPDAAAEIETKTQYRKSEKDIKISNATSMPGYTLESSKWIQTSTGYTDYIPSFPAQFDTQSDIYINNASRPDTYDTGVYKRTIDSDVTIGYVYWHWLTYDQYYNMENSYANRPVGAYKGEYISLYDQNANYFEYRTTSDKMTYDSSYGVFKDTTVSLPQDSPDYTCRSFWWLGNGGEGVNDHIPIKRATYTDYEKENTFVKWSAYSEWQDEVLTSGENTRVETRTLYRYKLNDNMATGHSYDYDCDAECNVCGEVRTVTHSYESVVTEPTCLENGYTVHTCTVCGDSYTDNTTPALGHSLTETVVEPTTSTGGYTLHECTRPGCGYSYKDNYTDPTVDIETAPKIVVESKTVRAGETFTVNVSVENNPGINTFSLGIEYNKDLFTLDQVECNSALNGQFVFSQKAVWISGQDTQYNGTVLTLTFTAKEDAAAGQEAVTISYTAGDISNYDEEDVNFLIIPGEVEIVDYIAGDINGDGVVNSKDLTRLMKYIAGDDVTVVEKALDVNGDGAVNNKDLTRLLKYLAGDDVEIH